MPDHKDEPVVRVTVVLRGGSTEIAYWLDDELARRKRTDRSANRSELIEELLRLGRDEYRRRHKSPK